MFDINNLILSGGLIVIGLIIFAESGILLGFFLPGDTLLLTAGLFAGQGKLPIVWLMSIVIIAAIAGYQVGYYIGERAGPRLFRRKDGILFREEYIDRTEAFFSKYGGLTVVGARFIAHVRTFVSVIAGAGRMNKGKYLFYNILGALLWAGGLTMLGYWLGNSIPNIDNYLIPAILIALALFYAVTFWGVVKSPSRRRSLKKGLKEDFNYLFGRSK